MQLRQDMSGYFDFLYVSRSSKPNVILLIQVCVVRRFEPYPKSVYNKSAISLEREFKLSQFFCLQIHKQSLELVPQFDSKQSMHFQACPKYLNSKYIILEEMAGWIVAIYCMQRDLHQDSIFQVVLYNCQAQSGMPTQLSP